MPRYEYSEGSSNKFWEITVKDNEVITHYGRIGADGQSTTKSFKSNAEAKSAYDKLIAEKTKKGYVLIAGGVLPASAPAAKSTSPGQPSNPLITRLDRWMAKERPEFYAHLKPGAAEAEIAAFEQQLDRRLPQTFKDLMMWRSGEEGGGPSERLIDNYGPMSIKEIASAWKGMNGIDPPSDFKGKYYWDKSWVPFLENGGGDYLCIDLGGLVGGKGAIIEYWHDEDHRSVCYGSIDAMLTSFVKALEAGDWEIEDSGYFGWTNDSDASDNDNDGGADAEDEDEEVTDTEDPPKSIAPFMKNEFPEILKGFRKRMGGESPISVRYNKCGDRVALLLTRAIKQTRDTVFFWFDILPGALSSIKRFVILPGEEIAITEHHGVHQVVVPRDPEAEDLDDLEDEIDTAICHVLTLPPLRAIQESHRKFIAEMNSESRLNVRVDVNWRSFVSNLDRDAIRTVLSRLNQDLDQDVTWWLRSHALNDKEFRQQLRSAVRSLRVEHVSSVRERKVFADGADVVYRFCLTKDGGTFTHDEFGEKLRDVVLKMKPAPVSAAKAQKDDYVQGKAPRNAESFVKSIEEASARLCKTLDSLVEFEIDWKGFSDPEMFDALLDHGVEYACAALGNMSEENADTKAKVAARVRTVRLRRATMPNEKSVTTAGSTIVYRLIPDDDDGWYEREMLQEAFEEVLDSMPAAAGGSKGVKGEIERLERELAKVSADAARLLGKKIQVAIDTDTIGNNLTVAREMDVSVIADGLRETSENEELREYLGEFAKLIKKLTVRATLDSTGTTCELEGHEWIIYLPAIAGNVANFVSDQLRELESQHYDEQREEETERRTADLGPQWKINFKELQKYTKTALSLKMEGDVEDMARHVTSDHGEKAQQCFDQASQGVLNALLMLRMEDKGFQKRLESSVKTVRFECADAKDVAFKDGVITCSMKMEAGASGSFTQDQFKAKLKKLVS
jgi:cell wall assembly regulator SMI1/predicted DNA-binding WGR domain protein